MPQSNDKQPEFVSMRGPLTVEAAGPGTDGEKALPKFRMVAYTGGLMRIAGFPHPVVVDLAGLDIPSQSLPIRLDHERRQGVGHTHRVTVESGQLVAEGLISRDTSWARDVARSGVNGFPWQASIGAAVVEAEVVPAGRSVRVNGRTLPGPVHVVRRAVLREISFVDSGADTGTTARIAARDTVQNKENHAMSEHETTTTETAEQASDAQKQQEEQIEARADESTDALSNPGNATDPVQAMRVQAAAESKRIAAIRDICANKHPDIEARPSRTGGTPRARSWRCSAPRGPAPRA